MKRHSCCNSSIIKVLERYKDHSGYRIYLGVLSDGRKVLEVSLGDRIYKKYRFYSKNEIFFTPEECDDSISSYLGDLFYFTDNNLGLLRKSKVARRWFMKRARNLIFGDRYLREYLIPGTNEINWNILEINNLL